MLDFGWAELLIIVAVAVFVIGPKDIPNIMYGLGRLIRRFQYMKYAVSQQFDDLMNSGDIEELRKGVNFESTRNEEDIIQERAEDEAAQTVFLNEKEIYTEIADQYVTTFTEPSDYLDKFTVMLDKGARILDVGCGVGVDANFLNAQGFEVTGVDQSEDMLKHAIAKFPDVNFIQSDMRSFDYLAEAYDGVISTYSLIHLKKLEVEGVLSNFYKTLKNNGYLFLSFHGGQSIETEQVEPFNPKYSFFLNVMSAEEVLTILNKIGFEVVDVFERPSETAEEMPYDKVSIIAKKIQLKDDHDKP